jgi:hypothetical protein
MPGELNPTEVGYPNTEWDAPLLADFARSGNNSGTTTLLADAELADHGLVSLGVVFLQIVQQAATLADQHEKSAARAVVFLVRLEVLRQLANPLAQQSDLNFRATGIARMCAVLVNEGFFLLSS